MAFKMNTGFLSFKIKAIEKPKKEKKPTSASLITGIIEKNEEYDYLVKVRNIKDSKVEDTVILKNNNDCKLYFEGINPRFVPFRPGIKVKGKLVTENGNKLFDIIEVCNPECYVSY